VLWFYSDLLVDIIFGTEIEPGQVRSLLSILPLMLLGMVPMLCSSVLLRAVLCLRNRSLYILFFGIGVPISYVGLCWLLSPLGFISIGFAYFISWIFGLGALMRGVILQDPKDT
jgi:hypothetical protein